MHATTSISHYYPFGLKQQGYNANPANPKYQYKYNGKELQTELDLNWTAMDFRNYDNALGRFNSMDVLAEFAYDRSPYRFAFNNPVFWKDPSRLFEILYDEEGNEIGYNITDAIEIEALNSFLSDNENASIDDVLNYVLDNSLGENALFTMELGEVSVTAGQKSEGYNIDDGIRDFMWSVGGTGRGFKTTNPNFITRHSLASQLNGRPASNKALDLAVKAGKLSKYAKGSILVNVTTGGVNIYSGYLKNGRTFGENATKATAETTGGVIGGVIGSVIGGYAGSSVGGAIVQEAYSKSN